MKREIIGLVLLSGFLMGCSPGSSEKETKKESANPLQNYEKTLVKSRDCSHEMSCRNNLRMISAAKDQWALEKNKSAGAVPTKKDLQEYFRSGTFLKCPDGGVYHIHPLGKKPDCSIHGTL